MRFCQIMEPSTCTANLTWLTKGKYYLYEVTDSDFASKLCENIHWLIHDKLKLRIDDMIYSSADARIHKDNSYYYIVGRCLIKINDKLFVIYHNGVPCDPAVNIDVKDKLYSEQPISTHARLITYECEA